MRIVEIPENFQMRIMQSAHLQQGMIQVIMRPYSKTNDEEK